MARSRLRRSFRILPALLLAALAAAIGAPAIESSAPAPIRSDGEHLYRIIAKVRLLLFWVGADDVGGARLTWRGAGRRRAISLLIGSDPARAPRHINEWGYIREDVVDDEAMVFGVRTVTDGDSPEAAQARLERDAAELGVLCSLVSPIEARSRTATVWGPRAATYRDIDTILSLVERHDRWNDRQTPRPPGAAPGFLTALDTMIVSSAASAAQTEGAACPRTTYIYKDAAFDLVPRRVQRVSELRTRAGVLTNLLRSEIVLKNRTTGWSADFAITYGIEGALAGVPVFVRYQPNWWFKVEFELDDGVDVPPDPALDRAVNHRISSLCAPVMAKE